MEPPQEVIKFEDTWGDDEQCVKWISRKEHLVHAIARAKMEKYLEELNTLLQSGKPFIMPGVGQLKADLQGHVSFTPEDLPLTRDTLELSPVIRTDASHKVTIGTRSVVNNQVVDHLTASSENTPPDYPSYPEKTSSPFRWWWVAVPVLLAGGFVLFMLTTKPLQEQEIIISADKAIPAPHVDSSLQQQQSADTASITASTDTTYYIVIETKRTLAAAKKKLNRRVNDYRQPEVTLLQDSQDTALYKLVVPFRTSLADTTKSKDSIRNKFKENVTLTF